jgi:hypothetical protein
VAGAQTGTAQTATPSATFSNVKMSPSDCIATWKKMDTGGTGLSQAQTQGTVSDFKSADTNGDGKLSQIEFNEACEKGLVSSSTGAARGTSGGAGAGTGAGLSSGSSSSSTTSPSDSTRSQSGMGSGAPTK